MTELANSPPFPGGFNLTTDALFGERAGTPIGGPFVITGAQLTAIVQSIISSGSINLAGTISLGSSGVSLTTDVAGNLIVNNGTVAVASIGPGGIQELGTITANAGTVS